MYARRSPFRLFLMIGLGILLGAALFGGGETAGAMVAAPLLILGFVFKAVLFVFLFGFIAKMVGGFAGHRAENGDHRRWADEGRDWRKRHGEPSSDDDRDSSDLFDEWHRIAHGRQEVDDHTPPVED